MLGSLVDQDQAHLVVDLTVLQVEQDQDLVVPQAVLVLVLVVPLAVLVQVLEVPPVPLVLDLGVDQVLVAQCMDQDLHLEVPQIMLDLALVEVLHTVLDLDPLALDQGLEVHLKVQELVVLLELLHTVVDLGHLVLYQDLDPQTKIPLISLLEYPEVVADQVALDLDDHLLEDHPLVTCLLQMEDHMADNYTI